MPELYHTEQLSLPLFKYCPSCKRDDKLLTDFHSDTSRPDGLYPICKDCINKRRRALRHNPQLSKKRRLTVIARPGYKICIDCETEKSLDQCVHNRNLCKDCQRAYDREWARTPKRREQRREWDATHTEQKRTSSARSYLKNRAKCCERNARAYAQKFTIPLEKIDYEAILKRDGLHCHICNSDIIGEVYHFDHVIPLARGGTHSEENIKIAHKICNLRKGTKLMEELTSWDRRGIAA